MLTQQTATKLETERKDEEKNPHMRHDKVSLLCTGAVLYILLVKENASVGWFCIYVCVVFLSLVCVGASTLSCKWSSKEVYFTLRLKVPSQLRGGAHKISLLASGVEYLATPAGK